jgi:hypothetical protein
MKRKQTIKQGPRWLRSRALSVLVLLAALTNRSEAAAIITSDVVFNSGIYSYTYTIQNTGTDFDLALITVPAEMTAAVAGIEAPTGFTLTYDAFQGWLNFTQDELVTTDGSFAPGTTVSGFRFNSPLGPQSVTFSAFDAAGTEFISTTRSPGLVPEPSVIMSMAASLLIFVARRRTPITA